MAILRDHGAAAEGDPAWTPAQTVGRSICMHAGEGPRRSQSVGSMVSELVNGRAVHWVTASSAPCLSVFKPVLFETGLPDQGAAPTDEADRASRWWKHERLHRAALDQFPEVLAAFAAKRDALEAAFRARIHQALADQATAPVLTAIVRACWAEADTAEAEWLNAPHARPTRGAFAQSWRRLNKVAGLV